MKSNLPKVNLVSELRLELRPNMTELNECVGEMMTKLNECVGEIHPITFYYMSEVYINMFANK